MIGSAHMHSQQLDELIARRTVCVGGPPRCNEFVDWYEAQGVDQIIFLVSCLESVRTAGKDEARGSEGSLALWERVRVRAVTHRRYSLGPHPGPLPEGEGGGTPTRSICAIPRYCDLRNTTLAGEGCPCAECTHRAQHGG